MIGQHSIILIILIGTISNELSESVYCVLFYIVSSTGVDHIEGGKSNCKQFKLMGENRIMLINLISLNSF